MIVSPMLARMIGGSLVLVALFTTQANPLFAFIVWQEEDPFAPCETTFARDPDHWRGAGCFYETGLTQGLEVAAAARLRTLIEKHPQNAWLYFNLGRIAFDRGEPEAKEAFENAVVLFADRKDISGEVYTRLNLYKWFISFEDIEAAEKQLAAVGAATESSDDPTLRAQYQIHHALHAIQIGHDFEAAYHSLLKTATIAFPDGPYSLKRDCLLWLGMVSLKLGRTERARHYYQRLSQLAQTKGDLALEANAKLHLVMMAILADEQLAESKEEALILAREVVSIATRVQRLDLQAEAYRLLGQLEQHPARIAFLEQAVTVARTLGEPLILAECLGSLAKELTTDAPERAKLLIDEAYDLVAESEQPWSLMIWLFNRMRVHYQIHPTSQSLDHAFSALEYVEFNRSTQFSETSKIGLLSVWTEMYYWLAGTLLKDQPLGQRQSKEQAFSVMERMRARSLLDAIQHPDMGNQAQNMALKATGEEISHLNRRLFDAKLPAGERKRLLTKLRDRELAFQTLKSRSPPDPSRDGGNAVANFPSLEDIENSLAENQAIFSFQISEPSNIFGETTGGSWLLVITQEGTRIYPMPDRQLLAPAIRTYLGLMADPDNREIFTQVSANLYSRLLGKALGELDAGIHRLIIVPDGPLHRLPFASLHTTTADPPLVMTYQISRVPSATVWWHWKNRKPSSKGSNGLVFADPLLPQSSETTSGPATRSWTLGGSSNLAPLPLSRKEGEQVVAQLGQKSQLFVGANANERQLKHMDLNPFQVLHFAAHAVVDESNPQRSAVVLSPGAPEEDGLLQPNEIEALALSGQIVVLSTCSSASGQILRGEGAMSLARAFLKAGASVVVATLQPLRDDHGSFFFNHFYRALAKGQTVATAIQAAQKKCIDAGFPPSSWAPVVAICRDEVRLPDRASIHPVWWFAGATILLFTWFIWILRQPQKKHWSLAP